MEKITHELYKYMLTNENIKKTILPKNNFQRITIEDSLKKPILDITKQEIKQETKKDIVFFQPKEKDTLFWCFYIAAYGEVPYELLDNKNIVTEKKIKFELIDKIRKNKALIKQYKFATLSHIENYLANETKIDLKTFLSLSIVENMNILYLKNKTCYQHLMNDTKDLYVFRHLENNCFSFYKSTLDEMKEITDSLYMMDNIEKPLKSISAYKVDDLVKISNKLGINIISNNGKKVKTKNELYESIVLYL
jgi:hypothetical protein